MQKIKIDFANPGLPQHLNTMEDDSQSRFFEATLYENGKAYEAPSGATYSIMYRGFGPQNQGWYDTINDGTGKRAACTVSGNVVTCEIARQALQVPGHVNIVLCVSAANGYMLKSWPIDCDNRNDHYDDTAEVASFFYITQVSSADWTQAIQAWEDLKNTIDPTLSIEGKAADAAKVGAAVNAESERAKASEEKNANGVSQLKEDVMRYIVRKHSESVVSSKATLIVLRFSYPVKKGEYVYVNTLYTGDNYSSIDIRAYDSNGDIHVLKVSFPIGTVFFFIADMDYEEFSFYTSSDIVAEGNTLTAEITILGTSTTKIEENTTKIEENTTKLEESLDIKYYNMVNPTTIIENASITKDGKVYEPNEYNDATDYILLKKNTEYYVNGIYLTNFYAFYDTSKMFVSNPDVTITVSPNYDNWRGTILVGSENLYFRGTISHGSVGSVYISNYRDVYHSYGIVPINERISSELKSKKLKGKKVLVIGDSISTDAYGGYKKWVTDLMDEGCFPSDTVNNSYHATGFVATYKESGVVKQDNFVNRIQSISDKDAFDLVIIFGGINDFIQSIPMGESGGNKSTQFKPAVDFFFDYLVKNFVQARIAVLLPLRTCNIYKNKPNGDQSQGFYQTEYSEYIHFVAKKYCLPVLNLTEESGFCPFIDEFSNKWTLTPAGYELPDGVHPTEEYSKKYLAPMIWGFIENLIN